MIQPDLSSTGTTSWWLYIKVAIHNNLLEPITYLSLACSQPGHPLAFQTLLGGDYSTQLPRDRERKRTEDIRLITAHYIRSQGCAREPELKRQH